MDISRRKFMGKAMQGLAVTLATECYLPHVIVSSVERVVEPVQPNVLIGEIVAGVVKKKEQDYLREYLKNPENTKDPLGMGRGYVAARMVDGEPEVYHSFTPEGMWCNFRYFRGSPRAFKFLKKS